MPKIFVGITIFLGIAAGLAVGAGYGVRPGLTAAAVVWFLCGGVEALIYWAHNQ